MTTDSTNRAGFSLLELLIAMAIFTMAAVSLTQALNLISISVIESVENGALQERLRGVLLAETRKPNLLEGSRETETGSDGIYCRIEIKSVTAENREGISLEGLFEVTVTGIKRDSVRGDRELDQASTLVYPGLFRSQ